MKTQSPTYGAILDMLFKLGAIAKYTPVYGNEFNGFRYTRNNTGKMAHRIQQEICIADTSLWSRCTSAEWHLVGHITAELMEYNALWHCSPELKSSSTVKKAIRGLITKGIIAKTETTDIYLVNPLYIRRGDMFAVLATTAKMLMDAPKVATNHIRNKRAVDELDVSYNALLLQ